MSMKQSSADQEFPISAVRAAASFSLGQENAACGPLGYRRYGMLGFLYLDIVADDLANFPVKRT
eukprot:10488536-Lingulodinium_polyedra.AAC.1